MPQFTERLMQSLLNLVYPKPSLHSQYMFLKTDQMTLPTDSASRNEILLVLLVKGHW
jgi:hypothetical protein